ncbi:Com family DNA-binding transcriptional regulator [uncultured Amphritea sp.]|uniref:Com family DNA-binding transcriptional regulator n=1 Tax=uncultured Amphritea sp. TaxID=981605 RepID=UPI00341BB0D7
MQDIRCQHCNKLLAKAIYTLIEIKCPRCGCITERTLSPIDMKGKYHGEASHPVDRRKT